LGVLDPPPQATRNARRQRSKVPANFFLAPRSIGNPIKHSPGTTKLAASIWLGTGSRAKAVPLMVRVTDPLVVVELRPTEDGETAQEMFDVFAGTAQERFTVPVNPWVPPTVTVAAPLPPTGTVKAVGFALTLKAGLVTKPGHAVTKLNASIVPRPVA